jgi:hypothetical protein
MAFTDRIYRALALGMAVPGLSWVLVLHQFHTLSLLVLLIGTPAAYVINSTH